MDQIKALYTKYGFPSVDVLFKIAKDKGISVRKKDIEEFLLRQPIHQKFRKTIKRSTGHIKANSINERWMSDLIDYQKYKQYNKGNAWILTVIDVFSRKAYAVALKNKSANDMVDGFEKIFEEAGSMPKVITTDNGKEYLNDKVQKLFDENDIIHDVNEIGDHNALGIIDRFHLTLKMKLEKIMAYNKNSRWLEVLDDVIEAYNDTPHSGIYDVKPNEVDKYKRAIAWLNAKKWYGQKLMVKVKKGDYVRKRIIKNLFSKGYEQRYSSHIYEVVDVKGKMATLDNGEVVNERDLLKIMKVDDEDDENKEKEEANLRSKTSRGLSRNELYEEAKKVKEEGIKYEPRKKREWTPSLKALEKFQ